MPAHALIDARSLELHALVAERLRHDPGLIRVARGNLERWTAARGDFGPSPAWEEWKELLDGPFERVLKILTTDSEAAERLRQSSPFVGDAFYSNLERSAIFLKYAAPRT